MSHLGTVKQPRSEPMRFGSKRSSPLRGQTPPVSSPASRLCPDEELAHICHPERSEGSSIFRHIRRKISRLRLEMTIATQSGAEESKERLERLELFELSERLYC